MAPEGAIISNIATEGETSNMVVVKWSEEVERSGDKIYASLWGVLYKEEDGSLVPLSVTDPDSNINCFTRSKEDSYWVVPGNQYNEEFNNWRGPINNGQFHSQTLKDNRKTEETWSKYAIYVKFNGIPREGNPTIPIKSYKDQCRDHMIRNGMWDVSPYYAQT